MGIFDLFKKKEKPEEWYLSFEGKGKLLDLLTIKKNDFESLLFIKDYLRSLPNIKKLSEQGKFIDTNKISQRLLEMAYHLNVDEFGLEERPTFYLENVLDPQKNPYVNFIKKLNHSYYGEILDFTEKLIFDYNIDTDDNVLYDLSLYQPNNGEDAQEYSKRVYENMKKYVRENNII